MDTSCLTKVYLESLNTDELLRLADNLGIDLPAEAERATVIRELFETAFGNEDDVDGADGEDTLQSDFLEAAVLPKQYNFSFIEVMIRDPLWAFVFWEIKAQDRESLENTSDFEGYCLRVTPLNEETGAPMPNEMFTVQVGTNDTAWFLSFPPAEGRYQVELCVMREDNNVQSLIVSRPFRLPKLLVRRHQRDQLPADIQEVYASPLACLSGALEFPVVRSIDRNSRCRESAPADDADEDVDTPDATAPANAAASNEE